MLTPDLPIGVDPRDEGSIPGGGGGAGVSDAFTPSGFGEVGGEMGVGGGEDGEEGADRIDRDGL